MNQESRGTNIKAIVIKNFGGPSVLQVSERDIPEPGLKQVRVRVRAAGVNPVDGKIRAGTAQQMFPTQLPAVLGLEVAGTVDKVGPGVEALAVGDEVLGFADSGGYAEYTLMTTTAVKPAELEWAAAASLPVAAETAIRVLDLLGVVQGETILIHGAAGGVGTLAVQFAAARGARVIGTARQTNHAYLRALGATPISYGEGLVDRVWASATDGVDAVLDAAGKGALEDSIKLRGGASRIVSIADPNAIKLGVIFSNKARRDASALADVARRVAEGQVRVTVSETYSLDNAAAAHEKVDGGHGHGKVVLLVN